MTSNDISNFLTSMSEAKRAFDAEPGYQSRIRELEQRILAQGQTIAHREQRIHELKQADETLIQKLRSVEAERDDAGFRALEEADKVQGLLTLVRGFVTDGLKLIAVADGKGEQIVIGKDILNGLGEEVREWKDKAIGAESLREHQQEEFKAEIERLNADLRLAQEQLVHPLDRQADTATVQGTEGGSGSGGMSSSAAHEPLHDTSASWAGVAGEPQAVPSAIGPTEGQSVADPTTAASPKVASHTDTVSTSNTVSGLTMKTDRAESEKGPFANTDTSSLSQSQSASSVNAATEAGVHTITTDRAESEGPFARTDTLSETASSTGAETTTAVASNASGPERNRDESTRFTGRKYFNVTYFVPLHEWLNKGGAREDYYWRPAEANAPLPEPSRASHSSN